MDVEVDRIVEELKQKVVGYNPEDIEQFFDNLKVNIDEDSWVEILDKLAEDTNIFRWFSFICKKLPSIAKADKSFVDLTSKIIQRVKTDMSSGLLCTSFIEIGSKNPDLGLKLFEMLSKSEDADLKLWSGLFLGGAAVTNPNILFQKIELEYEKTDPNIKAAFIKAVRVLRTKKPDVEIPGGILDLITATVNDQHRVVRSEATAACITFFDMNPASLGGLLLELTKKGSLEDKICILANLGIHKLGDSELEFEILWICSEENDIRVLNAVVQALFNRAKENPEKTLEILKTWIVKGIYYDVYEAWVLLEYLQESNIEKCFSTIESWIQKDIHPLLLFKIPHFLSRIFLRNPVKLMELLSKWKDREGVFIDVLLATLREVLSMAYRKEIADSVVDQCFSISLSLAEKNGLDVNQIIRGEKDRLFQSLKLIEELEIKRPELNYNEIYQNLQNYQSIRDFLGLEWFKEKERARNKTHPLLIFLSRVKIDLGEIEHLVNQLKNEKDELKKTLIYEAIIAKLYAAAFLSHLNYMLGLLKPDEQGTRHIRDGLKNEEQFWQTISELEIATSFKTKYPTTIEPKIGNKCLDVHVKLDDKDILFEVINPEMYKPLRYLSGVVNIKNRAKEKIAEEIDKQLKDLSDVIKSPLILVIDISRSEIDYEDILSALEGSLALQVIFDKQTHRVVAEHAVRSNDALSKEKPESKIVSAIIAYKRDVTKEGKIKLEGKIFQNPTASYPLHESTREIIARNIFSNDCH
ncbi:MAG: hypothetical protein QXK18_08165 [Candidatus Bathyarchaeia archaeon]